MPPPTRNQVFISYSHEDTKWREDLEIHLKPYLRDASIKSWSDKEITSGSKWFTEIKSALIDTKVAVMLVTPDFLASDFIHEYELGPLLKEAEQGGIRILWVHVRACAYKKTALKDYQALLDPDKPLANMMDADRDQAWVRICEEIEKAVGTPVAPIKKQNYLAETFAALRALDSEPRNNHLAVVVIATDFLTAILQSRTG
jgi:internalin A